MTTLPSDLNLNRTELMLNWLKLNNDTIVYLELLYSLNWKFAEKETASLLMLFLHVYYCEAALKQSVSYKALYI